ncbi:uncharacterized protein J4E84_006382 [Alternaria hordeiaustralica]|uniref:uncharacterized protein n=1 Tax=Alternaria hordeiaustralica TaxID=1187925 RepID=UPI0020C46929|nr:uncharacterized protein J4E84_006382 [Alternaria hordeiaustralica]KAI4684393.1 hypothetical protein J4E84_006382 [Alternaria hordeiaustralica]
MLWIKFFELKGVKPDTDLYRYSLASSGDKFFKPRSKRLIELLLSMPLFSTAKIATDWNKNLPSDRFPPPTDNEEIGLANARLGNTYQITVEEQVSDFFKKVKVETNHTKDHNSRNKEDKGTERKVQNIIGFVVYGKNSTNVTFEKVVDGGATHPTVPHCFWQTYGIKLDFPQAPLVDHGNTNGPIWLPVELAKVVPGQLVRHLLAPLQTAAIIKFQTC